MYLQSHSILLRCQNAFLGNLPFKALHFSLLVDLFSSSRRYAQFLHVDPVFLFANLLLSGQGLANPFNDMPGIRMLAGELPISIPVESGRRLWVGPFPLYGKFEEKKNADSLAAGLPQPMREPPCQKEIVFPPFYLVAPKNVMKSVFARKSRIGPDRKAPRTKLYLREKKSGKCMMYTCVIYFNCVYFISIYARKYVRWIKKVLAHTFSKISLNTHWNDVLIRNISFRMSFNIQK